MSYEVGQQIGISFAQRGSRPNTYRLATVVKVTKTRVSVSWQTKTEGGVATITDSFSIKTGLRIGESDRWYPARLTELRRAIEGQRYARQYYADANKIHYRQQMAEKLVAAARNDDTFRALLAELNSREYVA